MDVFRELKTQDGVEISKSVTVHYGNAGRGLFANRTIGEEDLVITIPRDQMITPDYVAKVFDVSYPEWKAMQLDCLSLLSLFVALEVRKGDASEFSTFLKSMPASFDLLLVNWPDDYDDFLMTNVLETKSRLQELYLARYKKINDFYIEDHKMTWLREEEFRYSFSAVKTRGMHWPHGAPGNISVFWRPKQSYFLDLNNLIF